MGPPLDSHALQELSRKDLVDLAKSQGLKANQKTSTLVEQLAARFADNAKKTTTAKKTATKAAAVKTTASALKTHRTASAEPSKPSAEPIKKVAAKKKTPKKPAPLKAVGSKAKLRTEVESLIERDQDVLDKEAKELAGGNEELLASFEAKLEQHKQDLLNEVDAKIQAVKTSPLLPPVELSTKRDTTPPSPFVEAMEAGTRSAASMSPISPNKRKRSRTVSIQEPAATEAEHANKRVRLEEEEEVPAPGETSRSPGLFSFFRRTASGRQDVPPPPLSPGVQPRDAPIQTLPFPLTAGSSSLAPLASSLPPVTPPANRTLFGTEREGGDARFRDGASPSRAWFGNLLGRS